MKKVYYSVKRYKRNEMIEQKGVGYITDKQTKNQHPLFLFLVKVYPKFAPNEFCFLRGIYQKPPLRSREKIIAENNKSRFFGH